MMSDSLLRGILRQTKIYKQTRWQTLRERVRKCCENLVTIKKMWAATNLVTRSPNCLIRSLISKIDSKIAWVGFCVVQCVWIFRRHVFRYLRGCCSMFSTSTPVLWMFIGKMYSKIILYLSYKLHKCRVVTIFFFINIKSQKLKVVKATWNIYGLLS